MAETPHEDAARDNRTGGASPTDDQNTSPSGDLGPTGPQTVDYSVPQPSNDERQDDQGDTTPTFPQEEAGADQDDDLPVSGDVTGGRPGLTGNDALAGAGLAYDDGIDPSLRTEMWDNARAYSVDTPPARVNDEPGFDDGIPNSFSDFSVVTPETPEGTTRLADPSHDAGGKVKGPRVGGSGGIDGGPPRTTPLPGETDEE